MLRFFFNKTILGIDNIGLMFYYFDMHTNKMVFPGIILLSGLFLGLVSLVSSPRVTLASSSPSNSPNVDSNSKTTLLAQAYPASVRQWEDIIAFRAHQYGLDPNLVAALILQESGGDAQAYSASGAVGLMQIMPRDGIAQSFQCGDHPCFQNRPSISELQDPRFNIDYGVRYLSALINKYGDIREALYHYGPMDVGYHYADVVLAIYASYH